MLQISGEFRRPFRSFCIAASLSALVVSGSALAAPVEILLSPFAPPNDLINTHIVRPWAEDVKRVTEGRVVIKFSDTSLSAPPQQWEMVTQGIADAGYTFNGFQLNRLLLPQVAHLPFLGPSAEASSLALWRTHQKFFEPAAEYKDVVLLGLIVGPTGQIFSLTDKPLDSVEKFKGLKTWGLPGIPAREADALGASVVPGPAVRIHDVVSKGIVDAFMGIALYHADAYNGLQFAKSATIVPGGISAPSFSLIMSKTAWAKIPAADQKLVMSVSGEAIARRAKAYDDGEKAATTKFLAAGGKVIPASAQLTSALLNTWQTMEGEWIASADKRKVDGKAALQFYRAELASFKPAAK